PAAPRPAETPLPPPATVPQPPDRPAIQEILPAAQQKQFLDRAAQNRGQARAILEQVRGQRLSNDMNSKRASIEEFLKLSEDAEKRGDARSADAQAERAFLLARELQGGK